MAAELQTEVRTENNAAVLPTEWWARFITIQTQRKVTGMIEPAIVYSIHWENMTKYLYKKHRLEKSTIGQSWNSRIAWIIFYINKAVKTHLCAQDATERRNLKNTYENVMWWPWCPKAKHTSSATDARKTKKRDILKLLMQRKINLPNT